MSIDFSEMNGSPTESRDRDGVRATRKLMCAWEDRWRLVNLLLRGIGEPYPHYPRARARRASPAPFEAKNLGTGSVAAYAKAIVTVEYETPRPGTFEFSEGDEIASESLSAAGEFMPVAVEDKYGKPLLTWEDGTPLSPQESPGRITRMLEYNVTRYEVETIPDAAFNLVGTVNESSVEALLLGKTFAAETLLYNDISPQRTTTEYGAQKWTKQQSFTYRPNGWNKVWRAATGQYERMYDAEGNARDLFERKDFTLL